MKRIHTIDFVRGVVMVIMALDHTRDLMHVTAITQSPTDLTTTTPALFFTRWITYFCAPIFVFLAGTSAYLSAQKQNDLAVTRRFLLRRGIWLVVLEFTVVNFAIWFDLKFRTFIFQVIAAIGLSFIVLALLLRLSPRVIGLIGLLIIFMHDLLTLGLPRSGGLWRTILSPLFVLTPVPLSPNLLLIISYPLIPWLGILLVGYAAGKLFERPAIEQQSILLKLGAGALVLFVVLRFLNVYGDPAKWAMQRNAVFTVLSFFNISKYPPSLLFTLLTLGAMFLLLAWAETFPTILQRIFSVYGRVPLFYYLPHFYLLHVLMFGMVFLQGFGWSDLVFGFNFGRPKTGSGVGLPAIYLIWLAVVAALYPLCRWYGEYKAAHHDKEWLRYL
ncbi:MAG: heparan-alpha-glucosaminide N-acetyltransferase domain-containing protein [Blastocatellia bacterium]